MRADDLAPLEKTGAPVRLPSLWISPVGVFSLNFGTVGIAPIR